MKRTNWPVEHDGIRPAGKPDECFYCHEKLGGTHKPDCVIRQRTVVVRMTVDYVIDVPEHWTEDNIQFHRNEGSWCSDNALSELEQLSGRAGCLCSFMEFSYLREGTEKDEEKNQFFVSKIPS